MSTAAEKVTNMNTEGSNVGTSFTADPENTHVSVFIELNKFCLVDCSDSELFLDGGDQRRSLEAGTFKGVKGFLELLDLIKALMELDDGDVLFTGGLLSLDQSGGVVDAHNEATSDFRVQSTRMTGLVNLQDFLDPCDNLVRGGV